MKKTFVRNVCLLCALFVSVCVFAFSCSSHIEDAKNAQDATKDADVDIEANIEVNFATLVLAYEDGTATAAGLSSGATYEWYLDNASDNLTTSGALCVVKTNNLSVGNHTLLVIATLDGKTYSESCTITKE